MEAPKDAFNAKSAAEKRSEYKPSDLINDTVKGGAITGLAGLAYASVRNALTKQNTGARGVFTKYGSNVVTFGGCT